ncbi:mitochondrial import inner membrane translocase subunit TIM16 [Aphanomyces cochlioides]|nr:mitochondrial import inner membrane translocase subunit TIM16 [Aphanomyces cochlioides]
MSGQIARLIANIVIAGAGVVSKAFVQAYQQAVINAKNGHTVQQAASVTLKNKMQKDQALEVLNLQGAPTIAEIEKQFERYFKANEPSKDGGGSYYLQSKIYRAKEALLKDHPELKTEEKPKE